MGQAKVVAVHDHEYIVYTSEAVFLGASIGSIKRGPPGQIEHVQSFPCPPGPQCLLTNKGIQGKKKTAERVCRVTGVVAWGSPSSTIKLNQH